MDQEDPGGQGGGGRGGREGGGGGGGWGGGGDAPRVLVPPLPLTYAGVHPLTHMID
jgi:hypothetical protein